MYNVGRNTLRPTVHLGVGTTVVVILIARTPFSFPFFLLLIAMFVISEQMQVVGANEDEFSASL